MHNLKHVLIIPDGNRRWAKEKGKLSYSGHQEGTRAFEKILKTAFESDIPHLTFWGLSLDNIAKRSKAEVRALFGLFKEKFEALAQNKEIYEQDVKINVLGRWDSLFPEPVRDAIRHCIETTKNHSRHVLTLLLAYNGKDEMIEAIRKIAEVHEDASQVDHETVKKYLWSAELPPVDLVIRTGGEPHLSGGLMMWQTADAQLYFTETLWPDFTSEEFKKALNEFIRRERRLGA